MLGTDVFFVNPRAAGPTRARNLGAQHALDPTNAATHTLWLDSDMVFPSHTLRTLLEHDKDIVGAAYVKRDGSGELIAADVDGIPMKRLPPDPLVRVRSMGFGCILIKREVYESVSFPYFREMYISLPNGVYKDYSEDQYFLERVIGKYDVWCDIPLSRQVGHLGVEEYKI
jgi:hypothetical protein